MKKIFIDTDVIISFTKGHAPFLKEIIREQRNNNIELFINPVVVVEFFTDRNLNDKRKYKLAERFFQNFTALSINRRIGLTAGELLRNGLASAIGDTLIAATCIENSLELMTNNQKDFKKVKDLKFFTYT